MNSRDKSDQFLAVVQAHKGIIYKVTNSYCKDIEDRKDLAQEIIIQLWRSFDRYNATYQYATWIYRIALNVAISFYRTASRRKRIISPVAESMLFFEDQRPDGQNEALNLLQKFIRELKELERALILLYLEEKSYKEISEIIGISITNVATKISRIKKTLKQKFEQFNQ